MTRLPSRSQKMVQLVSAIVLVLGATVVAAAPAAAVGTDVDCAGDFNVTFQPPITTNLQSVTSTTNSTYSLCVAGPRGQGVSTTTDNLNCVNVVTATHTVSATITWIPSDGGGTSVITWTNVNIDVQSATWSGQVNPGGRFEGDDAKKVITTTAISGTNPLTCLLGGNGTVTGASGTVVLTLNSSS